MSNYENENYAPDARDFIGSYLKKEDLNGPSVVTITDVRAEEVPGAARPKLVMVVREFAKALILNATNIRVLQAIFQSTNTGLWRGPITLYVDENVEYHGRRVGGIRVQPAPAVAAHPQLQVAAAHHGPTNGGMAV